MHPSANRNDVSRTRAKYVRHIGVAMEDNLKLCLCAFVRNRGKTVFTESLLLMGMSMDLRWMSYSDAKAVLKAMLIQGLLERSGDMVRTAFDVSEIDVPVAYRPSKELIISCLSGNIPPVPETENDIIEKNQSATPVQEDLMPTLMQRAIDAGMQRKDFIGQSNSLSRKIGIFIEAAALYVLRDNGADISDLTDRVYESVRRK